VVTYGHKIIRVEAGAVVDDYPLGCGVFELRNRLFYWSVGRDEYVGFYEYAFRAHRRFFSKKRAIAYLVQLKLEGHDVEL
jgi:hypothetical protein